MLHKLYWELQKLQLKMRVKVFGFNKDRQGKVWLCYFHEVKGNEKMLKKKTALLSLALVGSVFAFVGCSSNEMATSPESAQVTTAPDATATIEGSAGVDIQADPAAQVEPIQSSPAAPQQ